MNCKEAINLMDGYLDGELDPISNQKIEQHLRECRSCEQAYEAHRALVRTIASAVPYYKAPAELRHRVQSSLRNEIGAKATHNGMRGSQVFRTRKQAERRPILSDMPWNWLGLSGLSLAAAIIFAAIIVSNLLPVLRRPGADQFLAPQLIAGHVRSLIAEPLTNVASRYHRSLRPWR